MTEPTKKQKARITLVQIVRTRDGIPMAGDSRDYHLPGADIDKTMVTLLQAGFEPIDGDIEDLLDQDEALR